MKFKQVAAGVAASAAALCFTFVFSIVAKFAAAATPAVATSL